jgi:short-subunit dehydrogenase
MMEPDQVARVGISAMLSRRASVIAGSLNKIVAFSNRFIPRQMQRMVMQKAMSG